MTTSSPLNGQRQKLCPCFNPEMIRKFTILMIVNKIKMTNFPVRLNETKIGNLMKPFIYICNKIYPTSAVYGQDFSDVRRIDKVGTKATYILFIFHHIKPLPSHVQWHICP